MYEVNVKHFSEYTGWARANTADRVYPLSVAEGFQTGNIFMDNEISPGAVLFWHNCGFGYLSGEPGEIFLEEIYDRFMTKAAERRFLLITDNNSIIARYSEKPDLTVGRRLEYGYESSGHVSVSSKEHPGCCIKKIDEKLLSRIEGRIIPPFSWTEKDSFLEKGFGYAALVDDTVASAAFSAAVSSEEIDIGVETKEQYRGCGFAAMLTRQMCSDILAMGRRPVWAHSEQNTASMKTAVSCGFVRNKINAVIKRA